MHVQRGKFNSNIDFTTETSKLFCQSSNTSLGNGSADNTQRCHPPAFDNLTEMATYRLKNNKKASSSIAIPKFSKSPISNFLIPKLSMKQSPNSAGCELTPHEKSLKKIMQMRNMSISDDADKIQENTIPIPMPSVTNNSTEEHSRLLDSTKFVVDLSTALLTKNDKVRARIKLSPEQFEVQLVDCELPTLGTLAPDITQVCEIDATAIIDMRLSNRTYKSTSLGKILCSRFRCKKMPYVSHKFKPKHTVVPFAFNIPNIIRKVNVKGLDV